MISVSTNSYFTMVRAAQLQAIRTDVPLGESQAVPVEVKDAASGTVGGTASSATTAGHVVDVLV